MKKKVFNIDFALCHILRELGFHKESDIFFVKSFKGIKVLPLVKNNYWNLKHYDWNKYEKYKPEFSKPSYHDDGTIWAISQFPYYDYEGYICTIPGLQQIRDFCNLNNIHAKFNNKGTLILSLIEFYRSKSKHHRNAFEGYVHAIKNYPIN